MAISTAVTDVFKSELLKGNHDLSTSADALKLALYTSAATLGTATTDYAVTNEISGTGYTAGGGALVISASMPTISSNEAFTDFADLTFSTATITARGCLIYNTTILAANDAIQSHDFGSDKTSTAADFTIQFPAATAGNAIIRLA